MTRLAVKHFETVCSIVAVAALCFFVPSFLTEFVYELTLPLEKAGYAYLGKWVITIPVFVQMVILAVCQFVLGGILLKPNKGLYGVFCSLPAVALFAFTAIGKFQIYIWLSLLAGVLGGLFRPADRRLRLGNAARHEKTDYSIDKYGFQSLYRIGVFVIPFRFNHDSKREPVGVPCLHWHIHPVVFLRRRFPTRIGLDFLLGNGKLVYIEPETAEMDIAIEGKTICEFYSRSLWSVHPLCCFTCLL